MAGRKWRNDLNRIKVLLPDEPSRAELRVGERGKADEDRRCRDGFEGLWR
jgi:hypothetical protein